MSLKTSFRLTILATASAVVLTGCAIAPGYTDTEQEITETLQGSNFQPASREMRDNICLLYTSPSPRDATLSRMPSSA